MSLKIIVAGATGNTGGECVKALSKADNVEIFPFVRDTEKAKGLLDLPNVSALLKGDYSDEKSIDKALADSGATRAFLVCTGGNDHIVQSTNEINFIKACTKANVEIIVRVSTWGPLIAEDSFQVYGKAHFLTESYCDEHKSPVVHLRPNMFLQNTLMGSGEVKAASQYTYPFPMDKDWKIGMIDCEDVGAAGSALLQLPSTDLASHLGQKYNISGPTRVSYEDLLSEMSAAAGTTVKINTVSEEKFTEILKSIGLPEPLASSLTYTFAVSGGAAGAKYRNNIDFDACNGTSDALKKVYAPKSGLKEFFAKYGAAFKKAE